MSYVAFKSSVGVFFFNIFEASFKVIININLPITEGETPNCRPKTFICGKIGPKPGG